MISMWQKWSVSALLLVKGGSVLTGAAPSAGRQAAERRPLSASNQSIPRRRAMAARLDGNGRPSPDPEPEPIGGLRLRALPAVSDPAFPLEHDYFEIVYAHLLGPTGILLRSAEHPSYLQSLQHISYS